jgi:hypothetical protein
VHLIFGSLKNHLMHELDTTNVPPNLLLHGLIADALDQRHRVAFFIQFVFPAHNEPRDQSVRATTHTATGGLKSGMAHQIQDVTLAKRKPRFSDKLIVSADGHNLLA